MARLLLLFIAALLLNSASLVAQSDRVAHPISSAHLVGMDGKSELIFDEPVTESFTVEVRDLTGKVMFMLRSEMKDESCQSIELPIDSLKKGIYMVQVVGASGKTKTLKLQRN